MREFPFATKSATVEASLKVWAAEPEGAGGIAVTIIFLSIMDDEPHELLAETVISPLFAVARVEMLFTLELPVQLSGKTQLYDVAPDTEAML